MQYIKNYSAKKRDKVSICASQGSILCLFFFLIYINKPIESHNIHC